MTKNIILTFQRKVNVKQNVSNLMKITNVKIYAIRWYNYFTKGGDEF